jgi:OOP family OmpA-OmpF porin
MFSTLFANYPLTTQYPDGVFSVANVTLTGQVYCNKTKDPIASLIVVEVDGLKNAIELAAADNGKFTTLLPAAESIRILAKAEGYEPIEITYPVPSNAQDTTLFVEIYLTPQFELTLEGNVLDAKTNLPIEAEIDVFFDSDIIKQDVQIIHDGKFKEVVSKPGWYIIDVLSPGYLSATDTVWLVHQGQRFLHRDYRLTPIEVGLNVVIENLYFYFGHTMLKPESSGSLDKVVEFIKSNPTIALEIAGHTDDEGADDYNLTLSQGRAEAVVQYLVNVGVDSSRLIARGYGETKPIDLAKTKAAKARNRRVEFTILKK